jgi:hypothetical protein
MSSTVSVSVAKLTELLEQTSGWSESPQRADWLEMLASLAGSTVPYRLTERAHILGVYQARLESASARGDDGLGGLRAAVDRLAASEETDLAFVLISWRRYGFFVWLSEDASRVISFWQAVDQRQG